MKPRDIRILIVNCSLFNPTPSLAAMVINHFKLRSNIISYNLSGMGCSSSPISIDLARQVRCVRGPLGQEMTQTRHAAACSCADASAIPALVRARALD